jgi:starch synthase
MKLCLYSPSFAPLVGGIPTVTALLAAELVRRGVEVTVVTPTPDGATDAGRPYRVVRTAALEGVAEIAGAADLVHVNGMSLRPLLAAHRAGVPAVVTHQTYTAAPPRGPRELVRMLAEEGALRPLHAAASNAALRLARANVCISRALLGRIVPPRPEVIPNPFDPAFRPAPSPGPEAPFVFVGRLVRDKGADIFLEALARAAARGRRFEAVLYGDGPERLALVERALELGVAPQVTFAGEAAGARLLHAYREALAVVVPSRWPEPLGIVALEAMATGRAVIASEQGGLGEAVSGAGLLFPNGDARALADCLVRVAEDPGLRDRAARAGHERAAAFRLDRIGTQYLELYERVLAATRPARQRRPAAPPAVAAGAPAGLAASVVVAHPGTQHVFETAAGLDRAGLLCRLLTSVYYRPEGLLARAGSRWPRLGRRLDGVLARRRHDGLASARVETAPFDELMYLTATRLAPGAGLSLALLRRRNRRFQRRVARILERLAPRAVLAPDSAAREIFRAARARGVAAILDQTIGHLAAAVSLLEREAELDPEFAGAPGDFPAAMREACVAEAHEADLILAPSDYVRSTLLPLGIPRDRIALVPYGVDTERFRPAPPRDDGVFRALFVGHLSQRKGLRYLLEAFRRLAGAGIELVLAGPLAVRAEALAPYRGIFRHVGALGHDELAELYRTADVFVFPTLHEGSALVTYEALASGLPVITTAAAGSVVRDGVEGFLIPPRDAESLGARVEQLRADAARRRAISAAARRRAEEFTWAAYHSRLAAVVTQFLKGWVR